MQTPGPWLWAAMPTGWVHLPQRRPRCFPMAASCLAAPCCMLQHVSAAHWHGKPALWPRGAYLHPSQLNSMVCRCTSILTACRCSLAACSPARSPCTPAILLTLGPLCAALRKDVLAKCYGGDVSRKKKLLKKQAEGKKRMKVFGRVEVPQEAFVSVLSMSKEQ